MTELAVFHIPTRVVFGVGASAEAGAVVRGWDVARVLLVTDAGVVKAGIVAPIADALVRAGVEVEVFDQVEANPSLETVNRAFVRYRETACNGLVAIGGGSPMDTAKGAGILATNPGMLADYVGVDKVQNPLPPLLAIPTTVGTGSEVTPFAVVTDRGQRKKLVINSQLLRPRCALLDPELVRALPSTLVASTGMDALTHAIESVISVFATPFSDALALGAIRIISIHLVRAVHSTDMELRANLLYASTMAGMAFSAARTGLVHGMAHPLSAYCDVPHGLANAILLPYVLAFNMPACEQALERVAEAMGKGANAQAAIEAVVCLNAEVGIPAHLSEAGVSDAFLPQMARDAYESSNAQVVNPRKPSLSEVIELYQQAL